MMTSSTRAAPVDARGTLAAGMPYWHWQRTLADDVASIAADLVDGPWFELRFDAGIDQIAELVETGLRDAGAPTCAALANDVRALGELVAALNDRSRVSVRLEVTGLQTCPVFHQDNNVMRLLCTYAGPGTEWLSDDDVDRSQLGLQGRTPAAANAAIARGAPHRCEPGDVLLLTGAEFGERGVGVVHRSPPTSLGPRLFVTIDAIDGDGTGCSAACG
jgi:hypothetical protein